MKISNWNHWPIVDARMSMPYRLEDLEDQVRNLTPLIARGMGRSYGDASLGPRVLDCTQLDHILEIDTAQEWIIVEAGCSLDRILEEIVPQGFFLPVVPGTRFVSVGGAIAADIHGKNHHGEGSFGQHVLWFELIDESAQTHRCSPQENTELFSQSCGGMGLTGIITKACLRMIRIENAWIKVRHHRYDNIDALFEGFETHSKATYSVAWVDTIASGKSAGRAVLITGEHCPAAELPHKHSKQPLKTGKKSRFNIPGYFPDITLSHFSLRLFNGWYFARNRSSRRDRYQHYPSFFFPLDGIGHWNYLYGRKGFLQYQFVVPLGEAGKSAIREILALCRTHHKASFLTVLKVFGEANPYSYMGFPEKGYTLALDFKGSNDLLMLFKLFDNIVENAGGKLYLAKDARMEKSFFERTYARKVRSIHFVSGLSERLGLNKI